MKRTKTFLIFSILVMISIVVSCDKKHRISDDVLYDKLKGAWAGQIIGCTYGGPTEFRYLAVTIPDTVVIPWGKGEVKKWFDGGGGLYDDIYVDLTFVEALEKYGLDATADEFAEVFLSKSFPLCHANQQARYNLMNGCSASESGYWKNNPHANCLDFQIEADFAGIVAPGMVNSATDICDRVGHMLSYGDGWYGGVYVAAMYSMAYITDDIHTVVTEALKVIPSQSRFYECMTDVIGWYQENPSDWRSCWRKLEDKWGSADIACPDGVNYEFNIETYINCSYIILGLLYGEGDFFKTIDISTRAGQDSDCNPASAGGILGTVLGYDNIPSIYTDEIKIVEERPFNHSMSFKDGCLMSYNQALDMIVRNGGKVEGNEIIINVQKPEPVKYEVSFDGVVLDRKVPVENWVENFDGVEFDGTGAVIRGNVQGDDRVPNDYVALLEVYFNDKLVEICRLPLEYNHRKHELFFNYDQPSGVYKITCKWQNPVEGAKIWVRDVITYKSHKK